jgi:hypothetical protein
VRVKRQKTVDMKKNVEHPFDRLRINSLGHPMMKWCGKIRSRRDAVFWQKMKINRWLSQEASSDERRITKGIFSFEFLGLR